MTAARKSMGGRISSNPLLAGTAVPAEIVSSLVVESDLWVALRTM
jgi:hypothetical protein